MRRLLCLASLLVLGTASLANALPPARPTPSQADLDRLIARLADKDYRVRDQAAKALTALGKDALPALQSARKHPDAEVRKRVEELIPPLERAVVLTPQRVTLHVTNKLLRDILAELTKQTGYKLLTDNQGVPSRRQVVDYMDLPVMAPTAAAPPSTAATVNPNGARYTFHFDQVTFWEALDHVCNATGMILQNYGDDTLHLSAQDSYVPYVSYDGPFKVVATGFNYGCNTEFGQVPKTLYCPGQLGQEYLQLGFQVAGEPKAPILQLGQVRLLQAQDEGKNSMLLTGEGNDYSQWGFLRFRRYYRYYSRGFIHQTQTALMWTNKKCHTVCTVRGIIPVTLLAEQKPTVVTDKLLSAKGKKFKVGTTTFAVDDISGQAGRPYQVRLSLTEEGGNGRRDYSLMQSVQQRLEVQDDKGNKLPLSFNSISWGGTNAQFTFTLRPPGPKQGPPSKLVYNVWVLMEHEVRFAFKNLPLP